MIPIIRIYYILNASSEIINLTSSPLSNENIKFVIRAVCEPLLSCSKKEKDAVPTRRELALQRFMQFFCKKRCSNSTLLGQVP